MITLLLSTALAAPAGYTEAKRDNDCIISKGAADADGVVPVHAECHWKDVSPDTLHKLQYDWAGHARVFSTVTSSEVKKVEGGKSLVHQIHALSGVSNREVEIWMWREAWGDGFAYKWKTAGPITPQKGNVATTKHEGFWKVKPHASGGSHVEYQLSYDPGGSVPGFLIRWFQTSGTVATTQELRAAAK